MIQRLIQNIITLLREGFAGLIAAPETHIVTGPVAEPRVDALPVISIYPDKLEISKVAGELGSSQPRPQEFRQEIQVNAADPAGPYSLVKTPLLKSAICRVIFDRGALTERQIMLVEDKDFTIDYQNGAILFTRDVSGAGLILLKYSFVGIFTVCEFQQGFLADIYDGTGAEVEKLASLVTAMILTNHDQLIERYNFTDKTEYLAGQFLSTHALAQIQVIEGVHGRSDSAFKLQLRFKAAGQMTLTKEITEGFGLIEKIHSPGRISGEPVDIEIVVE